MLLRRVMTRLARRVDSLRCQTSDAIGAKRTCGEGRERVDLTKMTRCCRQGSPAALNSQFQLWARATNAASAAPNKMERRVSLFILRLQSAWMLCSRATGPHNRICSLTNFRSSSGPPSANVTCWVSLSCLATPGSRNDAASSSANLLTIALGVPAGAKTPHQA
jgi:hypothetical protein